MFKRIILLLVFSLIWAGVASGTSITIPVGCEVNILTSPAQWCADEYIVDGALHTYAPSAICGATVSGSGEVSLPVELSKFYAEVVPSGILLHWETAAEINNAGFYLYRAIGEMPSFQKMASLIPGAGTSNEVHAYSYLDTNVQEGKLYTYKLSDIEEDTGLETFHPAIAVIAGKGMLDNQDMPDQFSLHDNYPNPFNPTTTVSFDLPEAANLHLAIYDATGKLVRSFAGGEMWSGGSYSVIWNGKADNEKDVSSGTYFCKMVTEKYSETKAMVLLK